MQNLNPQDDQSVTPGTPGDLPSDVFRKRRATLQVDSLEPRILLSATMIDTVAVDQAAMPGDVVVEIYPAEATYEGYVFEGTEKDDWIKASYGGDVIFGGQGDDHLYGLDGNDSFVYREGDGTDVFVGGEGSDAIFATDAKTLQLSELTEKHSVETIVGSEGGLQIAGTANNDILDFQQTTLKNVAQIDAGEGDDVVVGSSADDVIFAGSGNDTLSGGDGTADVLLLSGSRSDYKIIEQKDGSVEVYDSRGTDGDDLIRDFETFQFADETVSREALFRDSSDQLLISDTSVSEDASAGTVVGKLWTPDEDRGGSHKYSLVDAKGNDVKDENFEIRENAIFVRDGHSLNYESSTSQTLYVKATDSAGASFIQAVTLNVKDANDAPVSVALSGNTVTENASAGTVVGKLTTGDEDRGDSHAYTLVDAKGNEVKDANFVIRENAIVVRDGHSLNFESSASQTLYVKSTDSAGASHVQAVTLNIKDANDAPFAVSLSETAISEDAAGGTVVGKLSTSDADKGDSHAYTLVDARGNEVKNTNFEIRDNTIVVRDGHSLNHESRSSETLYVKATDKSGATFIQAVTLNVKDANDAPFAVSLSDTAVSEDAAGGTVVGKLSTSDADKGDSHAYTLVDAKGNEVKDTNFEIRENTIVVRDGHSLNHESSSSETLYVKATDRAGATFIQAVTLSVKDANDAPFALSLSETAISEDAAGGRVVGKLSTSDADKGDSHAYALVDAKGNEVKGTSFKIRENTIVVTDGHSLDFESSASQTLYVKSTDSAGASLVQAVTLNIKDTNDAPVSVALNGNAVSEDASAGTVVGKLSTDDEDRGDSHTYSLVDVNGNDVKDENFEIRENAIVVRDGHSLNFESSTSQTLYVKATDSAGASFIQAVTLNVKDANDAPVSVALSDNAVSENASGGTVVSKLSTADEDRGALHTYSLVDANGNDVKDENFEIRENAIFVRDGHSLNYESSTAQTLYVKSTDSAGASHIQAVTLNVKDANDAPVSVSETLSTNEDQSVSVQFRHIDEDSEQQSESYRIESLPSHGQLLLNGRPVNMGDIVSSVDQSSGRLQFVPDRNWHGEDRISFRAFDGHQWSQTSADIQIFVTPEADAASLVVEPATGLAGGTISLQIAAGLPDPDSGEELKIYISGVPEGVILNAGDRQPDGTWILQPEDLDALTMTLSPLPPAQFSLTVTVVTSEANGSTAATTTELNVTVLPDNERQRDSQSDREAAVPFSAVPEQPQKILAPAAILSSTELPPVRIVLQTPAEVEPTGSGVTPLGYTFVLPVTETPDWSNTIFGEVLPVNVLDMSGLILDSASSDGALATAEVNEAEGTNVSQNAATTNPLLWIWSAARALGGVREERKSR